MRRPLHGQRGQVRESQRDSARSDRPGTRLPSQYREDLEVHEFRRDQCLPVKAPAGGVAVLPVVG